MEEVFTDETIEHTCKHGHYWRQHTNGQVTPSWGYGGTYIDVEDASVCPEPVTDADGRYDCASCGSKHRPGDGLRGMSCTPWEFDDDGREECEVPRPACGEPPVWSRPWGERNRPWDSKGCGSLYTLWWLGRRGERDRLVAYTSGDGYASHVIDLHTGELLAVSPEDESWEPRRTRKATVAELPKQLREQWPTRNGKPITPGLSDGPEGSKAPDTLFFMRHCNPPYMALLELADAGRLRPENFPYEFLWAAQECAENPCKHRHSREHGWVHAPQQARALSVVVRERIDDGRWPESGIDTAALEHLDERVQQITQQRAGALDLPSVQLDLFAA